MPSNDDTKRSLEAAAVAISKGHSGRQNLRELLIWTTDTHTEPMVSNYFARHLDDQLLLEALLAIAREGEDMGDAPWAAANLIAEFPAGLLARHEAELRIIADEPWDYLNQPAKLALAKLGK